MLTPLDSTHLCQLTATQIQEILVLNGVLIEQYQPQLHRWLTIAQLPDLGQLTLRIEPEKAAEIDRRLQQREIVEFTAMMTVMNLDICDRYVFVPLLKQPGCYDLYETELWGRICLVGHAHSVWTPQDLSWVQALGQQLLTALNLLVAVPSGSAKSTSSSTLSDLAELIDRIDILEVNCQQKDDFINSIAHDLRAPLMNIKMAMTMLKTSLETDPEISHLLLGHRAEKYLDILEQECDREVESIDRILDLQRLEFIKEGDRLRTSTTLNTSSSAQADASRWRSLAAGDTEPESLDLGALARQTPTASTLTHQLNLEPLAIATWLPPTIEPFIHRAKIDGQTLTSSVSQWLPTIETDRVCLTKIAIELLNNACKYTRVDGQISISIDAQPHAELFTIVVKNQAEISQQHLPRIFDQFYRVPNRDRSSQTGSGLGLSLVQKLVDRLNGQIHATSAAGWTEFVVKLPVNITN